MLTVPKPWGIGTGNCPPSRKLAGRPLVVTRFGSARMVRRFSCLRASMIPRNELLLLITPKAPVMAAGLAVASAGPRRPDDELAAELPVAVETMDPGSDVTNPFDERS